MQSLRNGDFKSIPSKNFKFLIKTCLKIFEISFPDPRHSTEHDKKKFNSPNRLPINKSIRDVLQSFSQSCLTALSLPNRAQNTVLHYPTWNIKKCFRDLWTKLDFTLARHEEERKNFSWLQIIEFDVSCTANIALSMFEFCSILRKNVRPLPGHVAAQRTCFETEEMRHNIGKRVHCWNFSNSTASNAFFAGSTWLWRAWLVHTFTSRSVEAVSLASNNVHYLNFSTMECVSFTLISSTSSVARSLPLFAFALGRHRERKTIRFHNRERSISFDRSRFRMEISLRQRR